jgi:hypothetical protein
MLIHKCSNPLRMTGEAGSAGAWLLLALLRDTMTTQRNERSHRCTKHKIYGGALCFMGVALVLHPL